MPPVRSLGPGQPGPRPGRLHFLRNEDDDRGAALKHAKDTRTRHIPRGRPKIPEVWTRYQELLDNEGRPHYLDVHDEIYQPGESWNPSTYPSQCSGPQRAGRMCGRINFCCWCYERRAHQQAVKAAMIHIGQPNIHRISIPLDFAGNHPMHARNALRLISRVLRRHNFTRQSLWLHPFGDNPFTGLKTHIEGIVSGDDADPDILDPSLPGGLGLTLRRLRDETGDGARPIDIYVERLHPHSRKHVDDLVHHGIEAGRPSWPVRRIHAGLYEDKKGRLRCRFTDVEDGRSPTHLRDLPVESDDHLPDATGEDILTYAVVAEHWRESVGRPVMTRNIKVEPAFADLVARATAWRSLYSLPDDQEMHLRYDADAESPRTRAVATSKAVAEA